MGRILYVPAEDWDSFYEDQAVLSGHGLPGFKGMPYQRGGGLGNFLGRLFRSVLPVLKKAGKAMGKQAVATGADIMADVARGRNLKEAAEEHGRTGVANLFEQGARTMKGEGLGTRPEEVTTKPIKRKAKSTKKQRQSAKKRYYYNPLKDVQTA